MPTIIPHSELLRRAVAHVSDARAENPKKKLSEILDEACMRFNLSPVDGEALQRLFSSEAKPVAQNPAQKTE